MHGALQTFENENELASLTRTEMSSQMHDAVHRLYCDYTRPYEEMHNPNTGLLTTACKRIGSDSGQHLRGMYK